LYFLFVFLPSPVALASVQRVVRWGRLPAARLFLMAILMVAAVLSAVAISFSNLESEQLFQTNEILAGQLAVDGIDLKEVAGSTVTTDQGNMLRVMVNKAPDTDHLDPIHLKNQFAMLAQKGLRDQVIHLPCSWRNTNCHGWVFAGGHFWVTGNEVDLILKENSYQEVALPVAGDLVVYRGVDNGSVTHSGIVRYVGNGSVLVESKWGRLGRFIHPHHAHCYGDDTCHFYRSSRQGHLLLGLPLETDLPSLPYRDVVETYKHTAPPASSLPIP